jgi:hypothetical protein
MERVESWRKIVVLQWYFSYRTMVRPGSTPGVSAGRDGRKGGGSCVKCGVQRPIPLSEWLEKLSWADGTWFLSEQAEKLAPAVKICVNQGWTEHLSSEDAQAWFFDQLDLAALNVGYLTQPIVKELQKRCGQVVKREAFFSPAYRGILQGQYPGLCPSIQRRTVEERRTARHHTQAWREVLRVSS